MSWTIETMGGVEYVHIDRAPYVKGWHLLYQGHLNGRVEDTWQKEALDQIAALRAEKERLQSTLEQVGRVLHELRAVQEVTQSYFVGCDFADEQHPGQVVLKLACPPHTKVSADLFATLASAAK